MSCAVPRTKPALPRTREIFVMHRVTALVACDPSPPDLQCPSQASAAGVGGEQHGYCRQLGRAGGWRALTWPCSHGLGPGLSQVWHRDGLAGCALFVIIWAWPRPR